MTLFLVLSALLTALVLAFLLRPLWRGARGVAAASAALILVSMVLLYRLVGTPAALDAPSLRAPESLGDAIVQLEAELQRNPGRADGWRLLAQAYASEGKPAQARDAYARAVALAPADPALLTEAAQARALAADDRGFDAQAVAWLQQALQAEPTHQRARWFLGIAQRQAGEDAAAAATWEPLLAQVDAATAASLRKEIEGARAAAGLPPLPASVEGPALTVRVALAPDVAARAGLPAGASVFVIAREVGGAPMPVAAEKHALADLPLSIQLDDGDSPMPTRKLSQVREVELIARISASGTANRGDGDIESRPLRVTLPASGPVDLVIGE